MLCSLTQTWSFCCSLLDPTSLHLQQLQSGGLHLHWYCESSTPWASQAGSHLPKGCWRQQQLCDATTGLGSHALLPRRTSRQAGASSGQAAAVLREACAGAAISMLHNTWSTSLSSKGAEAFHGCSHCRSRLPSESTRTYLESPPQHKPQLRRALCSQNLILKVLTARAAKLEL